MRHRKAGRQLRRTSEQRLALLRNLAISLIENGAIETTEAKAKELRPFVEKLITKGKAGTLHARRLAARHVHKRAAADMLFQEVAPKFATRAGGYTRILKTGFRKGDGAEMARIELIGFGEREPAKPRSVQPTGRAARSAASTGRGAAQ
jgi:large subunit ribosomal protein L17